MEAGSESYSSMTQITVSSNIDNVVDLPDLQARINTDSSASNHASEHLESDSTLGFTEDSENDE